MGKHWEGTAKKVPLADARTMPLELTKRQPILQRPCASMWGTSGRASLPHPRGRATILRGRITGACRERRMQESVARYAVALRHSRDVRVQIRVGVNSGEVIVRAVGSDLRWDYTAVGMPTHIAARMEQVAAPGAIL